MRWDAISERWWVPEEVDVTDPRVVQHLNSAATIMIGRGLKHGTLAGMWIWEDRNGLRSSIRFQG